MLCCDVTHAQGDHGSEEKDGDYVDGAADGGRELDKAHIEKLAEQAAQAASEELKTFWLSLLLAEIPRRGLKLLESGVGLDVHVKKVIEGEEELEKDGHESGSDETVDESDDESVATTIFKSLRGESEEKIEVEDDGHVHEEKEAEDDVESCCTECHQDSDVCHVCCDEVESHCSE